MKLIQVKAQEFETAMAMINMAKQHLKEQGVDQWQRGYPDEACIRSDIANRKGYFLVDDADHAVGYVCIDFDGEAAYDHLDGKWETEVPYVVAHRMAFSDASANCS